MKIAKEVQRIVLGQTEVKTPWGTTETLVAEAVYPGYVNGNGVAVLLEDTEHMPVATLSANVLGVSSDLPQGEFCAKLYSENEHLRTPMLASGMFEDTGRRVSANGFVDFEVWRIVSPNWTQQVTPE